MERDREIKLKRDRERQGEMERDRERKLKRDRERQGE